MMTPGGQGWNDPPSLSYETHSQTTSRRNLLTKRIGLPDLKLPENAAPPSGQNPTKTNSMSAPPSDQDLISQNISPANQSQDQGHNS